MKHLLSWKTFLRQILECLVIRATKNIEFERVGIYLFQSILNRMLQILHITVESNTEKANNSLFIEQNVVITFCLSICLLCFELALLYSVAEFVHFLDPLLRGYT